MGLDLREMSRPMDSAVFDNDETSEVSIANRFLRDLLVLGAAAGHPIPPVATRGGLYLYDHETGVWKELPREQALALIQRYDGRPITPSKEGGKERRLQLGSRKVEGVYRCATRDVNHYDETFFDSPPAGVAFKNGFATISPAGVELVKRSPDNRQLACVPYDYDPDATCPEWLAVLGRVFATELPVVADDNRKLLQEYVGACVAGVACQYTRALILSGGGNNGKSVVVETITEQLFPEGSVSYTTPQSWAKPEFLSRLRHARLNVANEVPANDIQASDAFKAVIDGGAVTARDLYANPYTLKPRAGHIFVCNELPGSRDHTEGFWRRPLVMPFRRDFTKDPDEVGRRTKEGVKADLKREAQGIMLWALHGAVRLLRQGGYTIPDSHRRELGDWKAEVDQVAAFVDECCQVDGGTTYLASIHGSFIEWCETVGRTKVSNRSLAKRLRAMGIAAHTDRDGLYFDVTVLIRGAWGIGKRSAVNG